MSNFKSKTEYLKDKSTNWSIPKSNIDTYKQSFLIAENVQLNMFAPPPPMFQNFIPQNQQFMSGPPLNFFQGPPPGPQHFFQGIPPPENFFMNQQQQQFNVKKK